MGTLNLEKTFLEFAWESHFYMGNRRQIHVNDERQVNTSFHVNRDSKQGIGMSSVVFKSVFPHYSPLANTIWFCHLCLKINPVLYAAAFCVFIFLIFLSISF